MKKIIAVISCILLFAVVLIPIAKFVDVNNTIVDCFLISLAASIVVAGTLGIVILIIMILDWAFF